MKTIYFKWQYKMKMKLIYFVALKLKCLKISLAKTVWHLFTKTIKLLKVNQIKFNQLKCS